MLTTAALLADPDVSVLMDQALGNARVPLDPKQKSHIIVKAIGKAASTPTRSKAVIKDLSRRAASSGSIPSSA